MSFHGLIVHFFLALNNTPLQYCTIVILYCIAMEVPEFIHLPTEGHLVCFQVLIIIKKAVINIHVQISVCLQCRGPGFDPWFGKIPWRKEWLPTPVFFFFFFFHSSILSWRVSWTEEPGGSMGSLRVGCDWATNTFGQTSRKVIDGSHGKSMFSFIRNCQTVLQRGCIILHSHQQWIQAPVILHLHQHLVLSMFWILILPIEGAVLLVHFCFVLFCFVGGGEAGCLFFISLLLPISEPSSMHSLQLRSAPLCLNLPRQLVLKIFQAQHKDLRKATSKSQLELSPPIAHSQHSLDFSMYHNYTWCLFLPPAPWKQGLLFLLSTMDP